MVSSYRIFTWTLLVMETTSKEGNGYSQAVQAEQPLESDPITIWIPILLCFSRKFHALEVSSGLLHTSLFSWRTGSEAADVLWKLAHPRAHLHTNHFVLNKACAVFKHCLNITLVFNKLSFFAQSFATGKLQRIVQR